MSTAQSIYSDKEYIILSEIEARQDISQRELAQNSGISLGTVNLLLKKMIKRGLVKMETIPANRVAYMLTPAGVAEKTFKTVRYVKIYYRAIDETKQRIKSALGQFHEQYHVIYIQRSDDEINAIMATAVQEYHAVNPDKVIQLIDDTSDIAEQQSAELSKYVVLYMPDDLIEGSAINENILRCKVKTSWNCCKSGQTRFSKILI